MKLPGVLLLLVLLLIPAAGAQSPSANDKAGAGTAQNAPTPLIINPDKPIKVTVTSEGGPPQGINPWWRDVIDAVAKIGTLVGVIGTLVSISIAASLAL